MAIEWDEPSSSYIESGAGQLVVTSFPFSFSLWLKNSDAITTKEHHLLCLADGTSEYIYAFLDNNTGTPGVQGALGFGTNVGQIATSNAAPSAGAWHHACGSWADGSQTVMLDGNTGSKGTGSISGSWPLSNSGTASWQIGRFGGGSIAPSNNTEHDGWLAWLCFWDEVLTEKEFVQLSKGAHPEDFRPHAIKGLFPMWSTAAPFDISPVSQREDAAGTFSFNSVTSAPTQGPPVGLYAPRTFIVIESSGTAVTPAAATVTVTGSLPTATVTQHVLVTPAAATVAIAGQAPTVLTPQTVTPDAGSVAIAGATPTVTITEHVVVAPAAATVGIAGQVPTVTVTANVVAEPAAATISLAGQLPTVTVGGNVVVVPSAATVTITGEVPTVVFGGPVTVTPAAATITVTGQVPTVVALETSAVVTVTTWSTAVVFEPGDEWLITLAGPAATNPQARVGVSFDKV